MATSMHVNVLGVFDEMAEKSAIQFVQYNDITCKRLNMQKSLPADQLRPPHDEWKLEN